MKTVCNLDQCAGCMACLETCAKNAIRLDLKLNAYNAIIDESKCINCGLCHKLCQANNPALLQQPIEWYQGWTVDEQLRAKSSSGGIASALEKAFVRSGGVVCSCQFKDGKFGFSFAKSDDELFGFCGSKYVKSNPVGIYKKLKSLIVSGKKVMFVGLPCQVSAVKNFVGEKYSDGLVTVDLICHGSPDQGILEAFFYQYGQSLANIDSIEFRTKTKFQIKENGIPIGTPGTLDKYTVAFLNGISYTENCYNCHYARQQRVSDITLGDSWGTDLISTEGISLIICQTQKGLELVRESNVVLNNVDVKNAIAHNHQLEHPSAKPDGRDDFFRAVENGKLNSFIFKRYPGLCFKQYIKTALIKLGLYSH